MAEAQPNPSEARLVLTQIVLENFKSYFGRRVIGPFHKRFSSIVGPNGSGKSNVIDALLFVFGRRSQKLRSKKVGELVHNSENHKNCKQAKVTIYFQEIIDNEESEDEYKTVENSEFTISRVVNKRNHSQYLMNDNTCTKADIVAKLLSKKIDLNNNRFLILQGEVESISLMKPKGVNANEEGLLEYLEDIIGSNKYVSQINSNEEQCEVLNNECLEKLNRVKIVERDRDKLNDAKLEAESYIKQELQKWKLQGISQQYYCWRLYTKKETLSKHIIKDEKELKENIDKSKECTNEIKKNEEIFETTVKKEVKRLEKIVEKKSKEFQKLEQEDTACVETLKHIQTENKRIKKLIKNYDTKINEINETIANNTKNIPELEEENVKLKEEFENESKKYEDMMDKLSSKTQPIRDEMEDKQKQLLPLKDKENEINNELDVVVDQIEAIKREADDANRRNQELGEKIAQMEANIIIKTQQIQDCEGEEKNFVHESQGIEEKQQGLMEEEAKLKEEYKAKEHEYNEKKGLFQNNGGHESQILKSLLDAQQRGHVSGVIGRLGDLGTIDEKYDVAVSTQGKGALNYIVVEKDRHAQLCVKYAKENRIGRTTYVILEKQKHLENVMNNGKNNTPENAPRLFDLIKPTKAEYACCFYYFFGETLVANSLEDANRLAFNYSKRYPVITLDGKEIALSGAMSGGGNRQYSGLMSAVAKMSDEEIQRIRNEIHKLEREMNLINNKLTENGQKRNQCKIESRECQRKIELKKKEIKKYKSELNNLNKRLPALQESARNRRNNENENENENNGNNELHTLEQEEQKLQGKLQRAKEACVSLEEDIERLKDQICNKGGDIVKKQKRKVDKMEKTLKENETNITKMKVEIKNGEKKLVTFTEKRESLQKEKEDNSNEKERIMEQRKEIENKAVNVQNDKNTAQEELGQRMKEFKVLKAKIEDLEARVTAHEKKRMQLTTQIKNSKTECKAIEKNIGKSQQATESLKLRFNENKRMFLGMDDELMAKSNEKGENGNEKNNENEKENENENSNSKSNKKGESGMEVENEDSKDDDNEVEDDDIKMDGAAPAKNDNNDDNNENDNANDNDNDNNNNNENENEKENNKRKENEPGFDEYIDETNLKFHIFDVCNDWCDIFDSFDISKIESETQEIEKELQNSKVNMNAIEAYRKKDDEYVNRLQDLQLCKDKREETRNKYEELKKMRFDEFMSAFQTITNKLKEMYRLLTCGGDAELELVDSIDPFSEGVQFSVRPPKKSWKNISNLSGGEKTLSSMALVFALHHFRPTPLYVMDEIDAALDFKNVSIVANYIKQRTKNAQFVIISLRNNMFELGNRLVGIYKTDNASKSITIDPSKFRLPHGDHAAAGGGAGAAATGNSNGNNHGNNGSNNNNVSNVSSNNNNSNNSNNNNNNLLSPSGRQAEIARQKRLSQLQLSQQQAVKRLSMLQSPQQRQKKKQEAAMRKESAIAEESMVSPQRRKGGERGASQKRRLARRSDIMNNLSDNDDNEDENDNEEEDNDMVLNKRNDNSGVVTTQGLNMDSEDDDDDI